MKDIVITGRRIRREFFIILGCLVLALGVNAGAIIAYQTQWHELYTTPRETVGVALVFYVLITLLRLAIFGVLRLVGRRGALHAGQRETCSAGTAKGDRLS